MSETVERNSGPSLREQLLKVSQEMSQTLIDCEQVAQNYLDSIAGAMHRLGVSSQDVTLGRFDENGDVSKTEFDTYRICCDNTDEGERGDCHVYKVAADENLREITAQGADLDTCNILERLQRELYRTTRDAVHRNQ
ncbi:hypothetical protein GWK77_01385 [Candidatus Saccharibacteria bacterium oral taxon 488]|nr:hypothetical protein GWK77_01385 [Candidatus Saccharibacteria bacterium oral taxon 488]